MTFDLKGAALSICRGGCAAVCVGEPLARSQTTAHVHGHLEATMGLAGPSLGRELRALALSLTAPVPACGTA